MSDGLARPPLSFRAINRRGHRHFDPGLQKHHLIPLGVARRRCFGRFRSMIGERLFALNDFRANGMLLPSCEEAVLRTLLPLHRGPHRAYSEMVAERLGEIEAIWAKSARMADDTTMHEVIDRLGTLRRRLRLQLMDRRQRLTLNTRDPLGAGKDFSAIDEMAEMLWQETG